MSGRLRLLAVHAHPDDESSKGAATMAMYASRGVEVMVVSCTGGERGAVLNPRLQDDPALIRDMAELRRQEMAAAARILGVRHIWLGFVDSGLPEGDPLPPLPEGCFALEPVEVTTAALVRVIRDFRPHVMTTYDENGGYPHPDHVMSHLISVAAFRAAADPAAYPQAGPPWRPLKLYYDSTWHRPKLQALHEALLEEGATSPFGEWLANWPGDSFERVTTRIRCADYFPVRDQALLAHATQIDPDGLFFAVPLRTQVATWPTEDFIAALSYVPIIDGEDDVFAGLGDAVSADRLALDPSLELVHDAMVVPPVRPPWPEASRDIERHEADSHEADRHEADRHDEDADRDDDAHRLEERAS